MSDTKQKILPQAKHWMLKLTCGMPQPLTLKIFMPSINLFFLPAVHNYTPLGAQQDRVHVASSF